MSKSKKKKKSDSQPKAKENRPAPTPAESLQAQPIVPVPTRPVGVAKLVSFLVLILVIFVIGIFSLRVMQSFLLPLFLAALVVVIFRPVHIWFLDKTANRKRLSAALTTAVVLLTVLGPFAWGIKSAIQEGAVLTTGEWDLEARLEKMRTQFGLQMPHKRSLEQLAAHISDVTPSTEENEKLTWRITDDTAISLAQLDEELANLETKVNAADGSPTQRDLLAIRDTLAAARDSADTLLSDGATPDDSRAYEKAIARLNVQLDKIRDDVCGGFPRAALVQLVNPSDSELEDWQTNAREYLQKWVLSISGKSTAVLGRLAFGLSIMVIAIYYFLIDGPEMIKSAMRLSPLDDQYEEELLVEFGKVSRAVVLATLLSALVQGLLAGVGYFFAGLDPVFLLTVMTLILALVPFVGAAAVWVPAALYLAFIDNRLAAGIGLGIYGFVVVSMADNVIKPLVLHGQSNLHPLMALLSVLGGVQALGPIGILVGPMLLAFLQALLDMLRKEISTLTPA